MYVINGLFYAILLRPEARRANGVELYLCIAGPEMPAVLNAFYCFDIAVGSIITYDIAIDEEIKIKNNCTAGAVRVETNLP